jgi:hypothetical protein
MLNFSRLSRSTHRIVKALISCQYWFMTLIYPIWNVSHGSWPITRRDLFDASTRVREKHVVQARPIVLDELDAAPGTVGAFKDNGQRLFGGFDTDVKAFRRRSDRLDRGLAFQHRFQ